MLAGSSGAGAGSDGMGSGAGLEPPKLGKLKPPAQPASPKPENSASNIATVGAGPKLILLMASLPSSMPGGQARPNRTSKSPERPAAGEPSGGCSLGSQAAIQPDCISLKVNGRQPFAGSLPTDTAVPDPRMQGQHGRYAASP